MAPPAALILLLSALLVLLGGHGVLGARGTGLVRDHDLWDSMILAKAAAGGAAKEGLPAQLPAEWSWSNVSGINYLTAVRNQHQPVYCGSCFAMGSTSALADRLSIVNGKTAKRFHLSVQTVLGCGHRHGTDGDCDGGDDAAVYQYAAKYGIPAESCSNYMAVSTTCFLTQPVDNRNKPECYTCQPRDNSGRDRCQRVKMFKKLFVDSFGSCSGYEQMKREIFRRGPISCSIDASDDQDTYTGGVYALKNTTDPDDLDHVVSITGWGIDGEGNEYWHLRNSWGSFWGEDGFMRIVTSRNNGPKGRNNNGIELECAYGVVSKNSWRHEK